MLQGGGSSSTSGAGGGSGGSAAAGGVAGTGHINKRGKYSTVGGKQLVDIVPAKTSKSNSMPDEQDDFLDTSFEPVTGAARLVKVPSEIGIDDARSRHDGSVEGISEANECASISSNDEDDDQVNDDVDEDDVEDEVFLSF